MYKPKAAIARVVQTISHVSPILMHRLIWEWWIFRSHPRKGEMSSANTCKFSATGDWLPIILGDHPCGTKPNSARSTLGKFRVPTSTILKETTIFVRENRHIHFQWELVPRVVTMKFLLKKVNSWLGVLNWSLQIYWSVLLLTGALNETYLLFSTWMPLVLAWFMQTFLLTTVSILFISHLNNLCFYRCKRKYEHRLSPNFIPLVLK